MSNDEVKSKRAKRLEEFKAAFAKMVGERHGKTGLTVEITDDCAIDMFGLGLLDSADDEWTEFISGISNGVEIPCCEHGVAHDEHCPDCHK